jgi:hypothetical protein
MTQREQILEAAVKWVEEATRLREADCDEITGKLIRSALERGQAIARTTRCLADAQGAEMQLFALVEQWVASGKP